MDEGSWGTETQEACAQTHISLVVEPEFTSRQLPLPGPSSPRLCESLGEAGGRQDPRAVALAHKQEQLFMNWTWTPQVLLLPVNRCFLQIS